MTCPPADARDSRASVVNDALDHGSGGRQAALSPKLPLLIDGVEKQLDAARDVVQRLSPELIDVRGALCCVDTDGRPLLGCQSIRGVLVDGTLAVAELTRRAGPLREEEIPGLCEGLGAAVPTA